MANLCKILRINFYQNWSSIVEVMTKKCGVFCAPQYILSISFVVIIRTTEFRICYLYRLYYVHVCHAYQ